jgi:hypothetical protein
MKPTPEEKCKHGTYFDCLCKDCQEEARNIPPSSVTCDQCGHIMNEPERGYCDGDTWHLKKPSPKEYVHDLMFQKLPIDSSPSPEARVDWEKVARELVDEYMSEDLHEDDLVWGITKALSAAFEKGREAR